MKYFFKRTSSSIIICLLLILSETALAQPVSMSSLGEVSEIIMPHPAKMQKNNNLYYEVHVNRTDFVSPSFWYKIIFKEDCFFEFTLFPLMEEDGYDFYFFKVEENLDFCDAVKEERLVSCNAARIYKQYSDKEQSDQFRSKLVNIKALPVKANDAIYIEVFSTVGHDCGHILDFRTSSTSFVVKVINDKCIGLKSSDITINDSKYKPVFTEKEAIGIFSNTVCHLNFDPVLVTAIKANPKTVTILKKLDYAAYSKSEASKYLSKPIDSLKARLDSLKTKLDSAKVKLDSVKTKMDAEQATKVVDTPKPAPPLDPPKNNAVVKSTADLNSLVESDPIKHEIVEIKSGKEKNSTRLDVDFVLFSLLKEDLKRKLESNREQLKEYNSMLRTNKDKEKKADITASIKEIQQQKIELLNKTKDTKIKLKKIQKRLNENRKKPVEIGESVFAKSTDPDDDKKQDLKSQDVKSVAADPKSPSTIVYKIQIGVYKNPISTSIFKGLSPVSSETFPGGIKYFVGSFSLYKDAINAKRYIKEMGLGDCFVVAYNNGKRVSVEDARNHENDGN